MRSTITALLLFVQTFSHLKLTSTTNEYQWVPKYHLAPEKGWINGPNGLSYFDDYYHAFYQYNPDATTTGSMHWGHARSEDMLDWEHLPIALAPSLPEDINGILSGSAVIIDGNLTLIYTGVSGNFSHQTQCLATSSDGVSFVKEGVVLRKDGDDEDFRDPKAWWQNESWFVVIGSKNSDKGEVLLYKSSDLHSWEFQGILAQADDKLGYMWESPDLFTLANKQVLVINPQGIEQDGYNYQNLYQTGYFVGSWTPGSQYQIEKKFTEIDHGHDFYASQTFLAPDGRRILIGWLGMWESVFPEAADGWAGMLTLPRELNLSPSGNLEIRPIQEIRDWRTNQTSENSVLVTNRIYTLKEDALSEEIILDFDLLQTTSSKFGVYIGDDSFSDEGVNIYFNSSESRLFLDRYYPQYNIEASSRSTPLALNGTLTLDIFIDSSSIEVFVNDGQAVLSSRIYPNVDQKFLTFFQEGGEMFVSYQSWNLNISSITL